MLKQGASVQDVIDETGASKTQVYEWRKTGHGPLIPDSGIPGSRGGEFQETLPLPPIPPLTANSHVLPRAVGCSHTQPIGGNHDQTQTPNPHRTLDSMARHSTSPPPKP